MASSRRGRQLTEDHRLAQAALKAQFLQEFMELWPLLDQERLDETGPAWIRRNMELIREYREDSAQLAEDYYVAFRAAEAPAAALGSPPPRVDRERPPQNVRPRQRGRQTADPGEGSSRRSSRGRLVRPRIIWDDADNAAETSLAVTGPANVKSKRKRGKSPEQAAREAVVEAGGSAARHVLTGGRTTHLEMLNEDPEPIGWIRVTDGDPCAFCAMLASRGPRYRSEQSAERVVNPNATRMLGDTYHDNCGCFAEAVFSTTQAWPGRGREFQKMWNEYAKGREDPINAFRRAYERQIREAARETA